MLGIFTREYNVMYVFSLQVIAMLKGLRAGRFDTV